jgi:hypothetical protein
VVPGIYTFREVPQTGWTQSYPPGGVWTVTLIAGQVDEGNDFGNFQNAIKSGMKFNDLDKDGVKDPGEPGLPGWTIKLSGTDGRGQAVNLTRITDVNGNYFFSVPPGAYTISEVGQTSWIQSYPPGGVWPVTLVSGQVHMGNDFGNWFNPEPHSTASIQFSSYTVPLQGGEVIITVSDTNDGNVQLLNPFMVLIKDPDDDSFPMILNNQSSTFSGGDNNNNGIMDPGETWTWEVTVFVEKNATFIVKGYGVTPDHRLIDPENGYPTEQKEGNVTTLNLVPGLSAWGILVLIVLAGGAMVWALRKRPLRLRP